MYAWKTMFDPYINHQEKEQTNQYTYKKKKQKQEDVPYFPTN